jgi:hypothetical protein
VGPGVTGVTDFELVFRGGVSMCMGISGKQISGVGEGSAPSAPNPFPMNT